MSDSPNRILRVEFLFLDQETCDRCNGAGDQLRQAVADTQAALAALGFSVELHETLVADAKTALELQLRTSPTIRINGRDIQPDYQESRCDPCGDMVGQADIGCRDWHDNGQSFTTPPKSLLVKAILRAAMQQDDTPTAPACGGSEKSGCCDDFVLPENLKRFFAAKMAQGCAPKQGCC